MFSINYLITFFFTWMHVMSYKQDCNIVLHSEYDYIVVGAGTAGSVVASRLSDDTDIKVLAIEAGSFESDIFEGHVINTPGLMPRLVGSGICWKYKTEPQKHCCHGFNDNRLVISRGKVMGGTSSLDNMNHVRGSPHVYDKWEELGAKGWNYESIKKYFIMSEKLETSDGLVSDTRGRCGPMTVTSVSEQRRSKRYAALKEAMVKIGWPVIECNDDKDIIGLCRAQLTTKNGGRVSSSNAYLLPVMKRPNIDVLTDALVTKLLFDKKETSRVTGIEFTFANKQYTLKAKKEVILSAGAIGTPKLLMLSGIGPKAHLESFNISVKADLPVGDNLQDKFVVPIRIYMEQKIPTYRPDIPVENVQRWRDFIYLREGELAEGLLEGLVHLRTLPADNNTLYHNLQISIYNMLPDYDHPYLQKMNVRNDLLDNWYMAAYQNNPQGSNGILVHVGLIHPQSKGTIRLRSANHTDQVVIDPQYLVNGNDVEDIYKGVKFVNEFIRHISNSEKDEPFTPCGHYPVNSKDYWKCYIRHLGSSDSQLTGTAKMGKVSDLDTVVDPELRVKNIKGLRVVDASIIPVPVGYTRATEIMIGERAADLIKAELKKEKMSNTTKNTPSSTAANSTSADENTLMSLLQELILDPLTPNTTNPNQGSNSQTQGNRNRGNRAQNALSGVVPTVGNGALGGNTNQQTLLSANAPGTGFTNGLAFPGTQASSNQFQQNTNVRQQSAFGSGTFGSMSGNSPQNRHQQPFGGRQVTQGQQIQGQGQQIQGQGQQIQGQGQQPLNLNRRFQSRFSAPPVTNNVGGTNTANPNPFNGGIIPPPMQLSPDLFIQRV